MKVRPQRLGHADSRLTLDTYTHIDSADDRRFAKWVGEMLLKQEEEQQSCVNEDGSDFGPTLDSNPLGQLASAWRDWLGGLDSNQDNQIQSLMYYRLYDLPAVGGKKKRASHHRAALERDLKNP